MNEEKIKQIARDIFSEQMRQSQYNISFIPFHTHNNIDSTNFSFLNLSDVPKTYTSKKGRTLIVNPNSNGLEFTSGVLATTATDGFITLPTCAGTPTGTPGSGAGASIYDTSANKLWIYNGSVWKSVALT